MLFKINKKKYVNQLIIKKNHKRVVITNEIFK